VPSSSGLKGRTLGRYQIAELIGAGGTASVYRALGPGGGPDLALKVLDWELARRPEVAERFRREAWTQGHLQHRNILPVLDFGFAAGYTYLATPFAPGGSMRGLMQGRPLAPRLALDLLCRIAEGLHHAHRSGVIHRDLKPSNVLIGGDAGLYLADFGLACGRVPRGAAWSERGLVVGTPGYMAPEQARGAKLNQRSDVYALGVIAFEMLTGRPPFVGPDQRTLIPAPVHGLIPSAREINQDLPEELDGVFARTLAEKPERRPPSALRLVCELSSVLPAGPRTSPSASRWPSRSWVGPRLLPDLMGALSHHLAGARGGRMTSPPASGQGGFNWEIDRGPVVSGSDRPLAPSQPGQP